MILTLISASVAAALTFVEVGDTQTDGGELSAAEARRRARQRRREEDRRAAERQAEERTGIEGRTARVVLRVGRAARKMKSRLRPAAGMTMRYRPRGTSGGSWARCRASLGAIPIQHSYFLLEKFNKTCSSGPRD